MMRAGLIALALMAQPLAAQDTGTQGLPTTGPRLGAASNLAQGGQRGIRNAMAQAGIDDLRDGMNWALVEPRPGTREFTMQRTRFPEDLVAQGVDLTLVVNWGNPNYDGGDTPHSPQALAALSDYVAELVAAFPGLAGIEAGNEFNGTNFVSGPLKDMTPEERARAYVPFLRAVREGARRADPDIPVSGGATHSMAAGYLWQVLDAGGAGLMEALAIHPYTTDPEQLARQVAVLRRHPDAARLPIEMTEFGHPDPEAAPGHLLRSYCQMALSGVSRAVWFPLTDRGDGMAPLVGADGMATGAGQAMHMAARLFAGRPVTDAAPDPFTYACRFGPDRLIAWGAPRAVTVAPGVEVLDDRGRPVAAPHLLDPARPLTFVAPDGGDVMKAVDLGRAGVLADSYDQFAYPPAHGAADGAADGAGFTALALRGGREIALETLPGQQRPGVPWFPYLGLADQPRLRVTADSMLPAGRGGRATAIVQRFVPPDDMRVALTADLALCDRSVDGVSVALLQDGAEIARHPVAPGGSARIDLPALDLRAGRPLDLILSPGADSDGDLTRFRITLSDPR